MIYQQTIIGAGFAGLNLAKALVSNGADPKTILLIDQYGEVRGSNLPRALLHPFVGRSLQPSPNLASAWNATETLLAEIAIPANLATPIQLIRPFHSTKGNRLASSFEKHGKDLQKDFSLSLLSKKETQKHYSFLNDVEGAIAIESAYQLDLNGLCQKLKASLQATGVSFLNQKVVGIKFDSPSSVISTADATIESTHLIFSPGSKLAAFFPELPIAPTRGHLAKIRWKDGIPKTFGLSMGGHLIHHEEDSWILGTTYFQPNEPLPTQESIFEQMKESMSRWVPALQRASLENLWSGVRCIFEPSRQPIAGPIPNQDNVFILSGFGSKGGLWAPLLAVELARFILAQSPAISPDILQPSAYPDAWKLDPT